MANVQKPAVMTSMPPVQPLVFVVTVTYGARQLLLEQVLSALTAQGVTKTVVVDNGAPWSVAPTLAARYGAFVDVVSTWRNVGSAGGYAAGIQRAIDLGAEFIWLLDDDNQPADGCLNQLLKAYVDEVRTTRRDRLAVVAFRPDHQPDITAGVPAQHLNSRRDSFCGLHLLDIPYKLWRRTRWGRPRGTTIPVRVRMDVAPYGGLLMHRDVVKNIGVPDSRFVLYRDDTEYSWRITACGGRIVFPTQARLNDLERSWSIKAHFSNTFSLWVYGDSDVRVYYGMRNQAYVDRFVRCKSPIILWINYRIYKWVLWLYARKAHRRSRYELLSRAIADGYAAHLGTSPEFPLP